MDREWLIERLDRGMSLEAIGRDAGRHPSTVAYWVVKHGLEANGSSAYAPGSGIGRGELEVAIAGSRTLQEIADRLGTSISTVRYWIRKHQLVGPMRPTRKQAALRALAEGRKRFADTCAIHGDVEFLALSAGRSRCSKCNVEAVQRRRRGVKRILIAEAGGSCRLCGYDRCPQALQFHHLDPSEKAWGVADGGVTRSLRRCREEASKCVLLCANCHAEVEAGVTELA